ncbi:MAG: orotidine-5'-phosphate decarboxylase [Bacteroidia bacterium]
MLEKQSYLCVGLDPDIQRLPPSVRYAPDPVFAFNKQIIEATAPYAVAYKPNLAFYESLGPSGWDTLRKTLAAIPPEIFTIADAKRGDIGNTSRMYARAFFETLDFDAVTVAPYMGRDSVGPFLEFPDKWVFVLALTSNDGAADFQHHGPAGHPLFMEVIRKTRSWQSEFPGHLGFVVGATQASALTHIRREAPDNLLLIPGVGAQGGDLHAVCRYGRTGRGDILVNASRSILYADSGLDFGIMAGHAARQLQEEMAIFFM